MSVAIRGVRGCRGKAEFFPRYFEYRASSAMTPCVGVLGPTVRGDELRSSTSRACSRDPTALQNSTGEPIHDSSRGLARAIADSADRQHLHSFRPGRPRHIFSTDLHFE